MTTSPSIGPGAGQTNDNSKNDIAELCPPDEPDFYEPFVTKLQRQNPLHNKGYWLRMRAIEVTVLKFLEQDNGKEKVVVSLGCGYDPLPFRILHRYPALSNHTIFVDVDNPNIIEQKKECILSSPLLQGAFTAFHEQEPDHCFLLRNDNYLAIGCDPQDTTDLEQALKREFDLEKQAILFVAEASISCKDAKAADLLIKWAASLNDARFCLLKQFLPNGSETQFAQTTIDPVTSCQTSLQSLSLNPPLIDQRHRFTDLGWPSVHVQSLWELWTDAQYVTAEQRRSLGTTEPFDKPEDLALFESLYFLLLAKNTPENAESTILARTNTTSDWDKISSPPITAALPSESANGLAEDKTSGPRVESIRRVRITSESEFRDIVASLGPCVLEGLDMGSCTHQWTPEYLEQKVGTDRSVIIHSCEADRLTFRTKNFTYVKKPFGEFIRGVCQGEKSYLRSVSTSQPGKHPTILERDFPGIAGDFQLPEALSPVRETMHSSPLRVSGPVTLWLHFDVLANVLCQIRGTKTLRLYPPSDAMHLEFPPGGSSSNIDVFTHDHPSIALTHPQDALLCPGDVLFIPPMWSHTARPMAGMSVAVNVFFRNLEQKYYAVGRDVYGNRDLQAYESGRKEIEKMAKAFEGMPTEIAKFYLERLAAELKGKAQEFGSE
ncbi:Clavaminate synthase-like protein [Lophium mytilinum]|uniref:tRNA wybutosine-synthesizing protein 4 n=1 Tax=Lophium mytilinum TaxID=390894 RepID=A0A6A6QJ14_9PEZI|nr:Clavaminate synthase-like protein [Lophium mytilinum]